MKLSAIPGLAEAIATERFSRNVAYLDLDDRICGVPVRPLTLQHLVTLETIGSPFIVGGRVTFVEAAGFLWLLSPRWRADARWRRWWFYRSLRKIQFKALVDGIREFILDAQRDLPGGKTNRVRASYYSTACALVDLLATEYGWSERAVLHLPLKRILQYRNRIFERNGEVMFNPSDEAKQKWLDDRERARN